MRMGRSTLTPIIPQALDVMQRALPVPFRVHPDVRLRIVERHTVAFAQNRVHRTLVHARLEAVLVGRAQPLLVIEQTVALLLRQAPDARLADNHRRQHRNRHIVAGLRHRRRHGCLRKVLRIVYQDLGAVERLAVGHIFVALDIDAHVQADILAGSSDPVDWVVQLIVDRVAGGATGNAYNIRTVHPGWPVRIRLYSCTHISSESFSAL